MGALSLGSALSRLAGVCLVVVAAAVVGLAVLPTPAGAEESFPLRIGVVTTYANPRLYDDEALRLAAWTMENFTTVTVPPAGDRADVGTLLIECSPLGDTVRVPVGEIAPGGMVLFVYTEPTCDDGLMAYAVVCAYEEVRKFPLVGYVNVCPLVGTLPHPPP